MVLRIRGRALPDGDPIDLYADGDRWTTDPVPNADLVAEGWLVPGLVDAHTHPGAATPGDPLDPALLRADLALHVDAGVTLIRAPGLAGDPPPWFGTAPDLPRAQHAGPWLARHGDFFDGWGARHAPADLAAAAADQAARTGWAKIIADWMPDTEPVPAAALAAAAAAVHAVGGRIAVHSQLGDGGAAAVAAGVDSIEHGMCLDPALLCVMVERGIALTPTLSGMNEVAEILRNRPDSARKRWQMDAIRAHGPLTAAAAEAGVLLLAGTDSRPHGKIANEVRALADAGVPPHDALAAASWSARTYLGLPGLTPNAPADAVIYQEDPRTDLRSLDHPTAVILRGNRVR